MAKELKKLGSNLDLKGIVIHRVNKLAGTHLATVKAAKNVLKIEEKEKIFIATVNKSYFSKSSPTYGIFANDFPDFKDELKSFLTDGDFFDFSVKALEHYNRACSIAFHF